MGFMHYDLGGLGKGKVIEVVLHGNTANVYLMDHENFTLYTKAQPFSALGGLMTFSPIRLQTIESAHWHLVIDLPLGKGQVKTSYRFTASKLPNISTRPSLFKPTEAQRKSILEAMRSAAAKEPPAEPPAIVSVESPQPPKQPPVQVSCDACGILTIRGKFCTECGAPMEKVCPTCKNINPLTCKFCFECGGKLE